MKAISKSVSRALPAVGLSALLLNVMGCASDVDTMKATEPPFVRSDTSELLGVYERDTSDSVYVSAERWSVGNDSFSVASTDVRGDFVILKNDANNAKNGGKFSRADYTLDDDGIIRLCLSVSDATSEAAAKAVVADASDLATGCAGSPWASLAAPELGGAFTDDWDGQHDINSVSWSMGYAGSQPSVFWLLEVSNQASYFLAKNDEAIDKTGGLFSRFDYFTASDGGLYYCQTAYNAATLEAARATKPADKSKLETGCAGFGWSKLTPKG